MADELWSADLGPVVCVVGARPNFMKMAPILRALSAHQPAVPALLVHTGQHYDNDMSDRLFVDLRLPHPDINLEVGSGTHAVQTADVMKRFEPVLDSQRPSCVLVVGDVNSTLAGSLAPANAVASNPSSGMARRHRGWSPTSLPGCSRGTRCVPRNAGHLLRPTSSWTA
jgi:hypothetical protein